MMKDIVLLNFMIQDNKFVMYLKIMIKSIILQPNAMILRRLLDIRLYV